MQRHTGEYLDIIEDEGKLRVKANPEAIAQINEMSDFEKNEVMCVLFGDFTANGWQYSEGTLKDPAGNTFWYVEKSDPLAILRKGGSVTFHVTRTSSRKIALDALLEELAKPSVDHRQENKEEGYVSPFYGKGTEVTAEIEQKRSPKVLPPRHDLRRHLDDDVKKELDDNKEASICAALYVEEIKKAARHFLIVDVSLPEGSN
jgi:hypothetical protein